jgi:hypothetical protein
MAQLKPCELCGKEIIRQPGSRRDKLRFCNQSCITAWVNVRRTLSIEDRFWANVLKTSTCWLWKGSKRPNGYGRLQVRGEVNKTFGVHRLSWELHNGPIPSGLFVCHKCDVPLCVNPEHLFLGTQLENMRDRRAKGR